MVFSIEALETFSLPPSRGVLLLTWFNFIPRMDK